MGLAFIRLLIMSNRDIVASFVGGWGSFATLPPTVAMIFYFVRGSRAAFLVGAVWAAAALAVYLRMILPGLLR